MANNILVDWMNKKKNEKLNNVQSNVLKKSSTNASNITTPNLPKPTISQTGLNLQKAQQPVQTRLNNLNNQTFPSINQGPMMNGQPMTQDSLKSRFIGLQGNNNLPSTDLGGNIIQANVDKKKKEEFDRRANKPVLNIPTKKSEIEQFNKKQSDSYRTNENVIKDFHYDVQKFGGQMTKEQISQLYPEFAGKEDIALMLQADILPLVQNNEFADMKKLSEIYPELLPKQKKVGDQILKDQEKEGQQIKDLAKKAEKTLSRYNVLSKNGEKYMQDVLQVGNFVDTIRKDYKLPGNPSDLDIINFGKENIPELKAILDDMEMLKSNYNLTERDRDIILNNGFDLGEWLYQAGADIQNFTQNNKLGDYLDRNSSTWERQLSNLGINGSSANTIANLPKKALDTAEIPVNMLGGLASGVGKVGIATERIATQQNRNEDGTTDTNGIVQDVIKGGGGALDTAFNTVMAIPTAIFHLAEETDAGSAAIDGTLGKMQRELDNLQSGKTTNSDNAFTQWYNGLDDEAKADLLNEEIMAIFHSVHKGGGKVKKLGKFEIDSAKNAINDVIRQKYSIESNSASFKAKVEQGLADGTMKVTDDGKLTDRDGNNIGKVKVHKIKTKDKIKYVVDKVISDNRAARNAKSLGELDPNALPDNRTFTEKAGEKAYNAGVKTREIYDSVKGGIDTVKEGIQDINVGGAVKGTAEAVGKGVKATSDLYNKGKNAVTQGKNAVTNAVKENVVEPFKKGYEGVKETVNENIVEPYNKGRGKTNEFNKKTVNQGQQLQESNSTSEINNKVNGDNYTQKNTNSKKLNKVQLKLLQNNNRMNPKSIDTFKEWYGEDYGQYMYDRGFTKSADGGNLDDMENYKNSLLSQKRATLNKIEGTYQDISLSDMAEHLVEKATTVRNRKLLKEAQELQNKHNETGLTMPEADRLRTLFQQNVKMGFHQDIPADARERAKNEYLAVKEFLDDVGRKNGFDDLDYINREIQKTQHIIKGVESKLNRESANNAYTLTDYILMAEAFTSPQTAAVFTAKQILKNPKVRSAGLNVAVGGRENAKNRVTAESREKTNENVESIAGAKRKQKEMGLSENPALPNGIKLSKITEIDKRKPTDTTPPTENTPTEKVEKTAPKKKSESKPKNKVTSKKSEVTEKKTEVKEEKKAEQPKEEKQLETRVETKQPESKSEPKKETTKRQPKEIKSDTVSGLVDELGLKETGNLKYEGKYKGYEIEIRGDASKGVVKWGVNVNNKTEGWGTPIDLNGDEVIKEIKKIDNKLKETNEPTKNIVTEKAGVTTKQEPKQEDKSGGNAFGLKEQKGSSRINNFTNVVKKIVDKYGDKIEEESGVSQLRIELGEPYQPLDIEYYPGRKQIIVSHPRVYGSDIIDDPGIRFSITNEGKLKPIGVRLAFMEQQGFMNRAPIKETDELLHTRAVNLEDQYLGERNIDEDTGVMKEEKSESAPKEVKDRTSNANIINNIKSFDDLKDLLKPTKAGAVSDWEYEGELNGVKTKVWNYGDTIFVKYGEGQGPAQARIDIADKDHIDQLKELLSEINNDGEILESNRSNPFSTKTEITGEKNAVTSKATETEKPKNLVTNKPIDNSSITGRFRNLTLQDYKEMQKYQGVENQLINGDEQGYILGKIKNQLLDEENPLIKGAEIDESELYPVNYDDLKELVDKKKEIQDAERKLMKKNDDNLSQQIEDLRYSYDNEMLPNMGIYEVEDVDTAVNIIESTMSEAHFQFLKDKEGIKPLVEKYGNYWEQGKSVDNKENTNIIGKNNSLTTKNPINERNNKASSGKENEGQSKLSNTVKNVQSNEGAGERPMDKGHGTSGKTVLNTSSNVTSEHGAGLTNGGTPNGVQPHKSIRTKGDNVITEKTVTQARDINRDCVDILEKHEFSDNPKDYTAEEIETLRQYEGRGGINDKSDTSTQGALNQYYTKDNIIKAMWRLLEGYNNTDILEPSMGVGRFFMYAPEGSNLAGFEYDKIPGTIAKILYPNADIKIGDFQDNFMLGKFSMGDNYTGKKYDIVIGNPPYEERQGRQKALGEEPKISRFDDYFIKRGVDMLKPGGHLAFVTSSQFLRGADNYAKQKISESAELIDAYRIPVGAFDRTGVETDIIVLRKKEGGGDASWLSASKWFDEHPDKVLGEERDDIQGRFGPKKAVVGDLAAIDEIGKARVGTDGNPATIKSDFTPMKEVKQETPTTQKTIEAKQEKKVKPKKEFKPNEWKDWTETKENSDGTTETITWGKSLNGIVFKGKGGVTGRMVVGKGGIDKYQNLLNANGKIGDPDIKLEDDREGLNYIAGELEPNLLYASGQIPLKLEQLEKDYEGGFIDEQQYNKQKDLLEQAIPQEIEFQNIYFSPYTDWILNFPTNEIKSGWVNGERADVKATVRDLFTRRVGEKEDSYGNITYEKKTKNGVDTMTAKAADVMLDIIDNKGKKYPQEAKEKVITILPKEYNKFLKGETLDASTKTELQKAYNTKYNSYANFDYSDLGYTVDDISPTFRGDTFNISDVQARGISRILTTESIIIAHGVGQGKTIEGIIGAIASMQQGKARKALIVVPAGTKADRMQTTAQLFPNQEMVDLGSLAKGTGIRKRLVEMYGPDPRDWIQDGQLVFLEHSAIGRQISFKNDTLTELEQSLTDAMESHFEEEKNIEDSKKQLERASKDLARAKENGASAADIEKKQKKMDEILGDIQRMGRTTENSLQDIMNTYRDKGLPDEGIGKALEFIDNDYDEFLHNMNEYLDNEINVGGAKIDKAQALEVAKDIFNNERAIYLEDLGIDHLTVDEAHNFRNLFNKAIEDDEEGGSYHAGMQVKEGSKQAKNLYAMSQYIMNKNGGGNVILLTATPFINNPSEMYNMLSYVGKNGMYEMGVQSMDDFYDTFVGLENRLTPTSSTSGVTYKNVMVGFHNVETLVKNLLDRYIDYEGESGKVVKPRLVTNVVRLKMSDTQMKVQKKLEEQIDKNEFDDEWEGNVVKTRKLNDKGEAKGAVLEGMTQANLNLISPYLTKYLKDKLSSITTQELIESSPKLKYHIEAIKLERKMGIMRGTFLYMEQGKELHEKLKKAIEEAIPGIRVGIINGDKKYSDLSSKEAEKLGIDPEGAKARQTAKKFSNGEIDVLIGGANTKEGLNLQGNGYHLIEISQPRNLNDRTQLIGRMQRQGNFSNEVLDTLLLMENSSDIYRFELMSRKGLRWNILEQLAAYKRGESIEDVVVDGQLDMDEEKLALFTDPEKKAKVSITMDKAALTEQLNQTNGQIATIQKLLNLMASWKNDYGRYRKLGEGTTRMDKLYDDNGKAVTTDILDENALEPLEQQLDYAWDEAMKKMEEYNSRRTEKWTKAEMEKNIKRNSPYSYESMKRKELKDKMQQARSERNLVIRQTDQLGIKTEEGLSDFISELEQQSKGINSKLTDIESTKDEKVRMFKEQAEANKANEMDIETMLKDLEEDYRHQVTLGSKEELRNWIELTKNLPKREQARSKNAVTGGKNKYSWKSEDYVGKKATFEKPKNLITSKHTAYDESNPRPETKYIGYTPKEIIKTKEGGTLTKIGYQQQFQKMNNTLNSIKKKVTDKEEKKSYRMQNDVQEILGKDEYYTGLKTRLTNMILKFAKRYDDEIIKAYKKDNPGKTPTGPEDFYNYINNYTPMAVNMNLGTESTKGLEYNVSKVEDEYVKQGAEYLFNKYNGAGRNNVTANDKNKITNG